MNYGIFVLEVTHNQGHIKLTTNNSLFGSKGYVCLFIYHHGNGVLYCYTVVSELWSSVIINGLSSTEFNPFRSL